METGMERLLLCWDDLDDLVGAIGLYAERIRRLLMLVLGTIAFVAATGGCFVLALVEPPLAMAAVTLAFVTMMYRSVTSMRLKRSTS
jgi:hypothetical protein